MIKINYQKLKLANKKSILGIGNIFPILVGIILLISILNNLIPKTFYSQIFSGNIFLDPFIGSLLGSILSGNPITAYILGNSFLKNNISLIAVTSFMVSWTTVGIIQLPAESLSLGKKFAIFRNITAFLMSIIVALITIAIISIV